MAKEAEAAERWRVRRSASDGDLLDAQRRKSSDGIFDTSKKPSKLSRTASFGGLLAGGLAGLTVTALLAQPAAAFIDNSFPGETFSYRGISWNVPKQAPTPGGFDWDTVAGCVDRNQYRYFCDQPKKMVISFDDGPEGYTEEALNILNRLGAKAVFCQVGYNLADSSTHALVRRMVDEGHALCIHTENHLHLTSLPTRQIIDEIMGTMERFRKIVGKTPRFFRAPFGEMDMRVRAVIQTLGLTALNWNLDTWDVRIRSWWMLWLVADFYLH